MPERTLITGENNSVLRKTSQKALPDVTETVELVKDMQETLAGTENGIGLAASQVGANVRVFVISPVFFEEAEGHLVYINPEITKTSRKEVEEEEGCLSLPGTWAVISRPYKVTIKAVDEEGKKFKVTGKGLLARLFQHEVDHLEGTLFIDYLSK